MLTVRLVECLIYFQKQKIANGFLKQASRKMPYIYETWYDNDETKVYSRH